jgi:hypothetical protein
MSEMLSCSGQYEFPGIPSTQEWHEDFPATQFPLHKPRAPYITPATSFNVPCDEAEVDGFDIRILQDAPYTPARLGHGVQGLPPTPMSIEKCQISRDGYSTSAESTIAGNQSYSEGKSVRDSDQPTTPPLCACQAETQLGHANPYRRRRRRPKKRARIAQSSTASPTPKLSNPILEPPHLTVPEPWPLPFPQSDRGIYPYLPPAKQFEQMVKFTSSTEEHIDKWDLHESTYPVPLLRQVLSATECVNMGFHAQLEFMFHLTEKLEVEMKPMKKKNRGRGKEKYKRITSEMVQQVRFMKEVMLQQQVCYYESRIPTWPNPKVP